MAELDPALATALLGARPLVFGAVEIGFASGTVRLLDGSGELVIDGETFSGRDPDWGVLDTIKGLADDSDDRAAALTLGLIPSGDLALATMLDPALQGTPVRVTIGCADPATGLPIGEPCQLFTGELDVVTVTWAANDRRVEITVTGVGERYFATEEGRRLSDAFHQSVWPGELGLAFVTGVETTVPWGQALRTGDPETRTNLPSMGLISTARSQ